MVGYEKEMFDVLKALDESGALKYCIVAGSWAMWFYKRLFTGFVPRIETTDLDLYLPNPKATQGIGLGGSLRKRSYIQSDDTLTGKTTFVSASGFEIEFLTTPDRTMKGVLRIPGLSIGAEALAKMAPIGWNYIEVEECGLSVKVASPVSFVLQKLLINSERKPETKKEKDLDAVRYVLSFVRASKKYMEELESSLAMAPKKWRKAITETAFAHEIDLSNPFNP